MLLNSAWVIHGIPIVIQGVYVIVNALPATSNSFALPEGLQSIGEKAFYKEYAYSDDGLTEIIIPMSVNEIGDSICNRAYAQLQVKPGSYAALYASENGYNTTGGAGSDDTSWLNS